jgi:hypothetical protein
MLKALKEDLAKSN